jgi:hypothetical protein
MNKRERKLLKATKKNIQSIQIIMKSITNNNKDHHEELHKEQQDFSINYDQ